jgi:hypothetical protein
MPRILGPAAFGAAALMVAMVAPVGGVEAPTRPSALDGAAIAWCGDVPSAQADASAYRDTPVYVWGNSSVGKVQKWARQQPGYQDLWIDQDNLNWIALGFTESAAKRQAELEELFPDVGVVAVPVDWTRGELRKLQDRAGDELFGSVVTSGGMSVDFGRGMVELSVGVVTDELVAAVAEGFASEPLCIAGPDPADVPAPGPQADAGDGWTML